MAETKTTEPAAATAKPRKKAAPALNYGGATAIEAPRKVAAPPGPVRGFGGVGGAADIKAAFDKILPHRGDWFLVAENVPNPGRFYDGFRALGAMVKNTQTGKMVKVHDKDGKEVEVKGFDIFAMVPPGELKPVKKSKASSKQQTQEKLQANKAGGSEAQRR